MSDYYSKIFNGLIGRWRIERIIEPGGVFSGEAVFTPKADGVLSYQESGRLTLDGGTLLEPQKAYEWRLEDGQIAVYFADGATNGQLFHALSFSDEKNAVASHWCDPDQYDSLYVFHLPHSFEITHTVSGPKKSYVSKTRYTPL